MRPPAEWFRFAPGELSHAPGETRPVRVRLSLPSGADPGSYEALVGAQVASGESGARVGAAAAARVSFSVEPASLLEASWLEVKTLFSDWSPWSWLVPLLSWVGLVGLQLRRRLKISVGRRA